MTPPTASTVALRGLSKSFGSVHAVSDLDLDVPAGQTVALLGPNGAGKSTTIDMLLGLTRPDAGSVEIFGQSPARAIAAGRVGAMLQSGTPLSDLSVREYLTMLASFYPAPISVAETLRLADIADIADRRTQKLSGGQMQRVRFGGAIISNPDLVVLDEPTVAMDVDSRRRFWSVMRRFTDEGRTVLFATHYLEEADGYADRIVLVARGRVVADGSSSAIKSRVGGRTVQFTLPDAAARDLRILPGVTSIDVHADAVTLQCHDSDQALRALVGSFSDARDIEITGARLEDAFVHLTHDQTEGALA